jgi:steroid delta-isomerase-like uncharacterized protein
MKSFKIVLLLICFAFAANLAIAQTSADAGKQAVLKFYETYGTRHDVDGCIPLFDHSAFRVDMAGMPAMNVDAFKNLGIAYLQAFPDLKFSVVRIVAEGDQVAALIRFTGTQKGELMGIPATGKQVDVLTADFWTVRNGKLTSLQSVNDNMTLMQQLGVIPAK